MITKNGVSMPDRLTVFATIYPKKAHRAEAEAAILQIMEPTRAEAGCRRFDLLRQAGDEEKLYLLEEWDDDAALEQHYAMDYTRAVFARYEAWLDRPVEVVKLRKVAEGA
jgi:quinol monooxygenase YgiN